MSSSLRATCTFSTVSLIMSVSLTETGKRAKIGYQITIILKYKQTLAMHLGYGMAMASNVSSSNDF